ncbi:MAG: 4-carboxymuconolactone decarboxylase [Alphaproteobacteria bacterium]|jgi:4-carboxymuconolactone decarboxylase
MPRLPIPSDAEPFEEETRAAVRHIQQTRKSMPPPSSYLTYAGQAGGLLSDLVEHLRYHTSLTDAETELAICTAARAADGAHIWSAHVKLGLKAGAREEAFHAIDTYAPLDDLTADEALIIGFGRELLESPQVSDETFAAVRARYGERGLMEITAAMSVYMMNATILRVMDHQAAADARPLTPR